MKAVGMPYRCAFRVRHLVDVFIPFANSLHADVIFSVAVPQGHPAHVNANISLETARNQLLPPFPDFVWIPFRVSPLCPV
mmetsp:Transcript_10568/g.17557  ORF Transcript_10568/g.17557 Transcript_10568/m.17557 type:complete len:80 (+) Transcript_10568:625-864(+)